jgi:hypothetical protein
MSNSRGQYKGLEQIQGFREGDRVTILIETTIENLRRLEIPAPDGETDEAAEIEFCGGYTLEFPTDHDAAEHGTLMTVRPKRMML